jgi:hypothetical protein
MTRAVLLGLYWRKKIAGAESQAIIKRIVGGGARINFASETQISLTLTGIKTDYTAQVLCCQLSVF